MKVIRAESMGMCFGVRDALQSTERVEDPSLVTIHGELVHNREVTARIEERGFQQTSEDDRDEIPNTPLVMITAHGISDAERSRLANANKRLIDTTCPLVKRVHEAARKLDAEGRHVLVLGRRGHVEVRGIVEDLTRYDVVGSCDEVRCYDGIPIGIVCQTTLAPDLSEELCDQIRRVNPRSDIRLVDTICQPTRLRQRAMLDLVGRVDAVVVVGGHNSNNTRQLVRLCDQADTPALHIEHVGELDREWLSGFATVGLTAGTSTLGQTIDEIHQALLQVPAEKSEETIDG